MSNELSGLLLVHKPKGPTSHDIVWQVRRSFGIKGVGHAGTLDPMAEGLLVLLLGEATKVSQWVTSSQKDYSGSFVLGKETDTYDAEGKVTAEHPTPFEVSDREIKSAFTFLSGDLSLPVPKFSAIKVKGKKLYDLARQGQEFSAPERPMTFDEVEYLGREENQIKFFLSCSKGTYVRSWVYEVGKKLKVGAYMDSLVRVKCGQFKLEDAIDFDTIKDYEFLDPEKKIEVLKGDKGFIRLAEALPDSELVRLNTHEEFLFSNGQIPNSVQKRLGPLLRQAFREENSYLVRALAREDRLAGLMSVDNKGQLKIQRVFRA